ncbi:DUF222 domain-containing protein [Gordonia jinghuaiqii]|uniref:DUF222 domain-containing protein n=1 Tax=Gordonia jinghuaiqii TaxID=2758710 RepID=UPI001FD31CAB|nr:DUF222 domain-containing protein [Gordonia jinghuaiqii]
MLDAINELRLLRNVIDHQIAVHVSAFDDSGAAEKAGSTTRGVLIEMGMPPSVAQRYLRIGGSLESLSKVAGCAAEGYLACECVDAIVRGVNHIEKRSPSAISESDRDIYEAEFFTQAFSGATPAEIDEHARSIGHRIADAGDGGVPAAEDATLNSVTGHVTGDGRVAIAADVTAVIGEKFLSMIDERSCPRPEPDGAADRRSREQRWADGFEVLLDQAAIGATVTTAGSA